MNSINRTYNAIVGWCIILFLPLGLLLVVYRKKFMSQKMTREKWEAWLISGMIFICVEIVIISILFYQFGRNFIQVMGTFY